MLHPYAFVSGMRKTLQAYTAPSAICMRTPAAAIHHLLATVPSKRLGRRTLFSSLIAATDGLHQTRAISVSAVLRLRTADGRTQCWCANPRADKSCVPLGNTEAVEIRFAQLRQTGSVGIGLAPGDGGGVLAITEKPGCSAARKDCCRSSKCGQPLLMNSFRIMPKRLASE
jgi:hypothetical protein